MMNITMMSHQKRMYRLAGENARPGEVLGTVLTLVINKRHGYIYFEEGLIP